MTVVPTKPKAEQLEFRSAKTGVHSLDDYLEACELGTGANVKTLPNVLGTLFDATTGSVISTAVQFRVKPADANNTLQARFGTYTNANTGWTDLNQGIFRQRGAWATNTYYDRLDFAEDDSKYWVCHTAHTSTGTQIDQSKFNVVFDGAQVLTEIQTFNQTTAPRLKDLENEVLLQLGIV